LGKDTQTNKKILDSKKKINDVFGKSYFEVISSKNWDINYY